MDEQMNVLLICGSGASSGFMAANMRRAAKKEGLNYHVKARSESELGDYVDNTDVLMIGPHLAYELDEIKKLVPSRVKTILMKSEYYSTLDGEAAIKHLQNELNK